ncbi:chitobiosyldiphosphodolichol beta-mannosyltransferase [Megalopta genalis]|uniref:chitobiosyldiphosphodolichol beta-mannosyltransferase n=1 Tax=Megalopta genalis TaxID=115081 RepID=UPI00144350B4|nr:chitobiosyldiphosphodolichol beta-mannosyltransferase [Megalopta genalis]
MWVVYFLCVFSLILFVMRKLYIKKYKVEKNICVVVLGDLGRSPRMQYHVLSLIKEGFTVDFVGYSGANPLKEIQESPHVCIYYLPPPPSIGNNFPSLVRYLIKTLWQTVSLCWVLFKKPISTHVLIQNAPAVPTIPVCWFYCVAVNSQFIVDWHNYAYTIMALHLRNDHLLVKVAKAIEIFFGSKAQSNFCVSGALKEDLQVTWGIGAKILYDRPIDKFHRISLTEKHKFLLSLSETYDAFEGPDKNSTIFTECRSDEVHLKPERPGFIVSSTSWTEDEDFSILLNALQEYENAVKEKVYNLPDLICVITGKGQLKEFYMAIIKLKMWKHVTILTPWLTSEDYPKILASADLGISLHTSSSGLDLPMKVVDMFGCELPVCAYNFNCLSELVKHNENGMIFSSYKELATLLKTWFENFPNSDVQHRLNEKFRSELHEFQKNRWHDNWISNALPSFQ